MKIIPLHSSNDFDKEKITFSKEEYIHFSKLRMNLSKYEEAVNDCSKALIIDNEFLEAYLLRFLLKIKMEIYPDAVDDFFKAISIEKRLFNSEIKCYEVLTDTFNEMIKENRLLFRKEIEKRRK